MREQLLKPIQVVITSRKFALQWSMFSPRIVDGIFESVSFLGQLDRFNKDVAWFDVIQCEENQHAKRQYESQKNAFFQARLNSSKHFGDVAVCSLRKSGCGSVCIYRDQKISCTIMEVQNENSTKADDTTLILCNLQVAKVLT